jgi:hypothetical protein
MTQTYDEMCQSAAKAQGLNFYMEIMQEFGISFDLWQTGGFTMVLAIPTFTANRTEHTGIYVTIGSDLVCITHCTDDEWLCAVCGEHESDCSHIEETAESAQEIISQLARVMSQATAAAKM